MSDNSLRDLLDADRDNLLDVVDWLAAMPQDRFDWHVRQDANNKLDPVAAQALRYRTTLERWHGSLQVTLVDLGAQLADPTRKTAEHQDWRRRALHFQTRVLRRRAEAQELLRRAHLSANGVKSGSAAAVERRDAGERAVLRLKQAHYAEFTRYLAEEYAADGITMPDRIYRHLRDHAAGGADA